MGDMADDAIDAMLNAEYYFDDYENHQWDLDHEIWPNMGTGIPLKEMEMSHIANAIKWIKRNGKKSMDGYGFLWLPKLEKELASRMPFEDHSIPF